MHHPSKYAVRKHHTYTSHRGLNKIHPICITFQRPIQSRKTLNIHIWPTRSPKKRDKSRFEFHFIHFFFRREHHLQKFTIQCCYLPLLPLPHTQRERERVSCKVIATCGSQQAYARNFQCVKLSLTKAVGRANIK